MHVDKTPQISNSTIVQIVGCLVICIKIDALICNSSYDLRLLKHIKAIGFSTSWLCDITFGPNYNDNWMINYKPLLGNDVVS